MLIKNHAHDSIYGCSIDKVHDEMMTRFEKVNSISNGIIKRTIRDLSQDNAPLSIINLSNFEYSGKVKITTENKLPKWMRAVKISSKKGFTDKSYTILMKSL
jgi:alpha-mannosidase